MRNTASPFYLLILWLLVSNVRAQQWVRTLDGGALGDDQAFSVVTTLDDDVIVTGQVDLGTHRCGAIAKYSSDGELVWLTPYDPFPGYTSGLGYIVAAPSGELYATASCRDSSDIQVAAVVKFSPGGALLHEFRYSHPDHLLDSPRALSFDGLGNILFLCRSQTNADRDDALLVKCDSACQPLWMTRYNLEGGRDTPMGLAVDSVGNAYVAGSGVTGSFSVTVGTFIKVAPNGDTLWTYVDGTPGEVTEFLQAAVSHDKIYAIGYRSIGRARALTMRFTGDGDTLWTKERTEGTSRAAAAVDTFGVVHTDMAEDSAATADMRTFAYSCNGSLRWVSRYDGPAHGYDDPTGVAVDPAREAIYTVGYSIGIGTIFDCTTLCYDFAGNRLWLDRYIGEGGNGNDAGQAIYVDSSGNIIVAGYTTRVGTGKDILVIKYPPTGPGLEEARGAKPATTIRVVPTVARNVCRFNVPSGTTSLTIADAAGRAVCALPCAGATWLAWDCRDAAGFLVTNGVYFVTAQTLSGSSTAKFLIRR